MYRLSGKSDSQFQKIFAGPYRRQVENHFWDAEDLRECIAVMFYLFYQKIACNACLIKIRAKRTRSAPRVRIVIL